MFGLKLKSLDWKSNAPIFAMLTILALSVFFVKILALSITVLCYIAISILFKEKVTG
jgi:hypothetical protein